MAFEADQSRREDALLDGLDMSPDASVKHRLGRFLFGRHLFAGVAYGSVQRRRGLVGVFAGSPKKFETPQKKLAAGIGWVGGL